MGVKIVRPSTFSTNEDCQPQAINRRRVVQMLVGVPTFFTLFMFFPAGTWGWMKGWLFLLVVSGTVVIAVSFLWRVNPEVVVARSWKHEGTKRWDTILLCCLLPSMYAIIPVAALDDSRFHWYPLSWWICGIGYFLLIFGLGIATWAEAVNKFFEPTVRIQTERSQMVIETGPYAVIRHPGYVGLFFIALGTALSLGSFWALIPAGLATILLILRTQWEDLTLQAELTGYKEYTKKVRDKLIPGVW